MNDHMNICFRIAKDINSKIGVLEGFDHNEVINNLPEKYKPTVEVMITMLSDGKAGISASNSIPEQFEYFKQVEDFIKDQQNDRT